MSLHPAHRLLPALLALVACEHNPLPASGAGGGGSFVASRFVGLWVGTWTNLTLNTSGPARLAVESDGDVLAGTIDLDGDVFGAGDPPAQTFVASIGGGTAVLPTQTSNVFGQVGGQLTADGNLTASISDVPPGLVRQVDIVGVWLSTSLEIDATLTYASGSPPTTRAALRLSKQ